MHSHDPRPTRLGALACVLLTCAVAPPLVRGASEEIDDGGGCNGGRHVVFNADSSDEESTGSESSSGTTEETSEPTTGGAVCGDGVQEGVEGCDDGNDKDEDGCPSGEKGGCAAEAVCGDGIVWVGEETCDDGNLDGGDGCEADCTKTPAECGNGTVEAGEGCDDGNEDEEDGCPSGAKGQCQAEATCGDGFVWVGMEGCDDGNEDEEDECPSGATGQCKAVAACGDGFTWAGMEGCDDGNEVETDACPSGATGQCKGVAACGDGFVWGEKEGCDDANEEDLDGCSNSCAPPRYVFVTSNNGFNGNLGGIAGADASCQMLATAAGLPGTYMAWLTGADAASAPATRFASTAFKGWYLLPTQPPTPVAQGWADLTSPNEDVPANYLREAVYTDETGQGGFDASVWTNTQSNGLQDSDAVHCSDWSTDSFDQKGRTGHGKMGVLDSSWTELDELKCNTGSRLYCFQVG